MTRLAFYLMLTILIACGSKQQEEGNKNDGNTAAVAKSGGEAVEVAGDTPKNVETTPSEPRKMVLLSTSFGDIKIELYNETPGHRDNFLKLVGEGFYNDLLFHRVIKEFMIQGGDPDSKGAAPGVMLGNGGPGYTIPAEIVSGLIHKKGALAAARLGDQQNPTKASSGSQFYLVHGKTWTPQELQQMEGQKSQMVRQACYNEFLSKPENEAVYRPRIQSLQQAGDQQGLMALQKELDQLTQEAFDARKIVYSPEQVQTYGTVGGSPHLDGDYTVFGQVVEGLDVIDKIAAVQTASANRPAEDIKMTIKIIE